MEGKSKRLCLAFSVLELLFILILIGIMSYVVLLKPIMSDFDVAVKRIHIYLKQTRLQSFMQDHYTPNDPLWHKKRWSLKFLRCKKSQGGIYYVIYSDTNQTGHPSLNESLQDPLNKKYIFSTNSCNETDKTSPYVLLTSLYNIVDVQMSCNTTSSLGQISFGADGRVYTKLDARDNASYEHELLNPCKIDFIHENGSKKSIIVHPKTGLVEQVL